MTLNLNGTRSIDKVLVADAAVEAVQYVNHFGSWLELLKEACGAMCSRENRLKHRRYSLRYSLIAVEDKIETERIH